MQREKQKLIEEFEESDNTPDLQRELTKMTELFEKYKSKFDGLEIQSREEKKKRADLHVAIDEIKAQLAHKASLLDFQEKKMKASEQEFEQNTKKVKNIKKQNESLVNQIDNLKELNKEFIESTLQYQIRVNVLSDQLLSLGSKVTDLNNINLSMARELESFKNEERKKERRLKTLREMNKKLSGKLRNCIQFIKEVEKIKENYQTKTLENKALEDLLGKLKQHNKTLSEEYTYLAERAETVLLDN